MAKKKTTTQKQKQKQSVIINLNTSNTKPRRKYAKKTKGQGDNNPPKPPQQPQMIIHQQAFAPQPLIQNPTPSQFIQQVQPSALHQSAVESRGNCLERTPAPPPRLPTPPPSEDNTHPFSVNEPRKREYKKMTHY